MKSDVWEMINNYAWVPAASAKIIRAQLTRARLVRPGVY